MKIRLFSFLACCLFSAGIFAQLPSADRSARRAQNRAESRVNNKVDNAVDNAVDEVFGSLFGKKKKTTADATEQDSTSATATANEAASTSTTTSPFQSSGEWEAYTNQRSFSFTMEFTTTKKNGKQETSSIDYAVIEDAFALKMNDGKEAAGTRLIMDTQTGKTTTVTTDNSGKASAIRMKLPNLGGATAGAIEDQATGNYTVNRTGERQVIDGYNCEKIIVTDQDRGNTTTAWVTQDIDLTWEEMFTAMTGFAGKQNKNLPNFQHFAEEIGGLTIKATSTDGKETTDLHYKNIKLDDKTDRSLFNLQGIEVMDLGF